MRQAAALEFRDLSADLRGALGDTALIIECDGDSVLLRVDSEPAVARRLMVAEDRGRALALSGAELLVAWDEERRLLAVPDEDRAVPPQPEAPQETTPKRNWRIGIGAGVLHSTGEGASRWGGFAVVHRRLLSWLGAEIEFFFGAGEVGVTEGTVQLLAVSTALRLSAGIDAGPLHIGGSLGYRVSAARWSGTSNDASVDDGRGWGSWSGPHLQLGLGVGDGSLRGFLFFEAGYALQSSLGLSDGAAVYDPKGLWLGAGIGLGVAL